ncbi:MAG: MBOAT family protein [Clostridiales bacterium]|uniref:MBOAT family O-acyltransferase n=1 Tax=Clostridium sp. N3C TaxID=1776758 RepID=UPI00092DFB01|nr:MBOAT family O-acyltransferase [Clostridium sp. N3C]NLZ49295.1 MBOAT family protein [Clostridiales bacterium]SCN23763.1 D-alanyl-lipoteichoic acid biosynthesis protein DltB [Clostridium sp. N3C]
MLFDSIKYLIFFPTVTIVYFLLPQKIQWLWLLTVSYFFYMLWNPKYAILLAFTTFTTYFCGILIDSAKKIESKNKVKITQKIVLSAGLILNLGSLFLFKYYNFFSNTLRRALSLLNISINIHSFDYLLPVGISFYTLQAISYIIDVYREDVKVEKHLGKYALFVSFFPTLLSGPIEKSKDFIDQLDEKHSFHYDRIKSGLYIIFWGLFKKLMIADRIAILVNEVYNNPNNHKGLEIILATVLYGIQIYCDFSSYTDMARGSAEILGFRLINNFHQPYFSKSIKEFWRNWHISLSTWFRDYLYFPLGGSRKGKIRTYINLMIVFIVSGLWHGSAFTFIIWGALHGLYQVVGKIIEKPKNAIINKLHIRTEVFSYRLVKVLITFILVDFAWLFFRANSLSDALLLIKNSFYFNPWIFTDGSLYKLGLDGKDFTIALVSIEIVFIVDLLQRRKDVKLLLFNQNLIFRWMIYIVFVVGLLIFGVYGPAYSQQQFIYMQF